jgi:hypothetical protein
MGYLRSKENVYWCIQVDKNGQTMDNERIIGEIRWRVFGWDTIRIPVISLVFWVFQILIPWFFCIGFMIALSLS